MIFNLIAALLISVASAQEPKCSPDLITAQEARLHILLDAAVGLSLQEPNNALLTPRIRTLRNAYNDAIENLQLQWERCYSERLTLSVQPSPSATAAPSEETAESQEAAKNFRQIYFWRESVFKKLDEAHKRHPVP